MIISASRRTDIPAFYSNWFMNRIKAGYCAVPNPFNHNQISYVSMKPEAVDVIVFWTRNAAPLLPSLEQLNREGYKYYFQYTIMDNPQEIDPKSPDILSAIKTFKKLADRIGPERVIWRYDPIVFSNITDEKFHLDHFEKIANELQGYTYRSVISIVDIYKKASRRLSSLEKQGVKILDTPRQSTLEFTNLMNDIVQSAQSHNFEVFSCSEVLDLSMHGIQRGKCVDDEYIQKIFNLNITNKKDPSQRAECGCVISKDIGMYDTCLFGCQYCYATTSFEKAKLNHDQHNPESPSLNGWFDAGKPLSILQDRLFK